MTNPKPGDTVDPRTLPVGARFTHSGAANFVVSKPGWCRVDGSSSNPEGPIISHEARLVSLPQPIADEVVELGTLAVGERFNVDESETDIYDRGQRQVHSHDPGYVGDEGKGRTWDVQGRWLYSTRKVRRVPAPTQRPDECPSSAPPPGAVKYAEINSDGRARPPCDACGEESTRDHDLLDLGRVRLCDGHYFDGTLEEVTRLILARRRARQSPGEPDGGQYAASSLPTYDQIAGWLGAEWVMTHPSTGSPVTPADWLDGKLGFPCPWFARNGYMCHLKHTPTGQRVEVTAPRETPDWEVWFERIRCNTRHIRGTTWYGQHVRWLDPDTKTSGSGDAATRKDAELASSDADDRFSPQPEESRWQTTDPARIATLEAKLAEQVASGGQDCKAARSLVERADRLRREEQERLVRDLDALNRHQHLRCEIVSCGIQPGPRLMRHELPEAQRACWKRR